MQLGLVRHLVVAFSMLMVLTVSGCGQKGDLYRENQASAEAVGSAAGGGMVTNSENADESAGEP
ncbi:LPS translocon maturation chaperone LptM [Marinobacter sp. VGCF2001]|uniref:LPS translocon maturation chaperone LptM n=1 Tax=Marinobacter sp. VGCF2001 TaxID=3417189 RepID=UPI003CE9E303